MNETPPLPPQPPERPLMPNEPPWGLEVPLGIDSDDQWWGDRRRDVIHRAGPVDTEQASGVDVTEPQGGSLDSTAAPLFSSRPACRQRPRTHHVMVLFDLNDELGRTMAEYLIQALTAKGRPTPAEELRARLEAALDDQADQEGADDGH